MVTMFGRQRTEGGLDARIAELSARRAKVDNGAVAEVPVPEQAAAAAPVAAPRSPVVREVEQLITSLAGSAETQKRKIFGFSLR